jgi:signal transduction histidine kinase/ActR/RegA family two-component response regulator
MAASRMKYLYRHSALFVLLALTALSCGAFVVTRRAAESAEKRLLHERATEVGGVVTDTVVSFKSSLSLLGQIYSSDRADDAAFRAGERSLTAGGQSTIGVAEVAGGDVVVRSTQGRPLPGGAHLTGARADLVRRAASAEDLVTTVVHDSAAASVPARESLMVALSRPDGVVVFEEVPIDPTRVVPSSATTPYHELNVVLYVSPTANAADVLLTTTPNLTLSGRQVTQSVAVGADHWLLVASARGWLGGSLAQSVAWIILVGGIIAALIVAAVVALLIRRREYAVALVEERTAELRGTFVELDAAREAADVANQSKSAFLSRMSHELRTPLNAVLGFAQILDLDDLDDGQQEAVDQILRGGKHLLELINEVLDISRIESGDLALSPEPVQVSDVVEETVSLIRPLAEQRSIQLLGETHSCWGNHVLADRQRLKQILLNLLSNAVKYNRQNGTVTIFCEHPDTTRLRIKVGDTGPGIRTEQLTQLFVPFERLGAERTDIEGTGIGLALSRRLAEAMGGTIGVESVPGEGSTFWVELPVVESPLERYDRQQGSGAEPEPAPVPSIDERRQTLLYIEDNLANLKLVQRVVAHRSDVEIIPAMQGSLGVDLAREHQPALILLDLHLPDMSGDAVLQQLRQNPATAPIPVVIVSADATPGQRQRLLNAGANGYLTKPYEVQELLSIIDDALARAADQAP